MKYKLKSHRFYNRFSVGDKLTLDMMNKYIKTYCEFGGRSNVVISDLSTRAVCKWGTPKTITRIDGDIIYVADRDWKGCYKNEEVQKCFK